MTILQQAIQLELDGIAYYEAMAERHGEGGLAVVFRKMAGEEARHARLLKNRKETFSAGDEKDSEELDVSALLKNIFPDGETFHKAAWSHPDQLEAYRFAQEKEKQSIDIYRQLLAEADSEKMKELCRFLIGQEEAHYTLLGDIVQALRHPKDWVEAAEFGIRKEEY